MRRNLIILALVGLLAACTNQGNTQTDEPSASAPMGSTGATGGEPSAACAEAFAPIADMNVETASDLADLEDEVTATVEACESVEDWIAGANEVVGTEVRPGAARLLLGIRCDSPELADTPICEEL